MSRPQDALALKRKRAQSDLVLRALQNDERMLYDFIRSKRNTGVWVNDLKKEVKIPPRVVDKSLKGLLEKNFIKIVDTVQKRSGKLYMATEFEPATELTGGSWYSKGELNTELIDFLKQMCHKYIKEKVVATAEAAWRAINNKKALEEDVPLEQISEILKSLVLENEIMEVRSTGTGDFAAILAGAVCYRCTRPGKYGEGPEMGALASIPCGVCPNINVCTPGGLINPIDCVYYKKFLEF